jgi:hypothetical protein
MATVRYCGESTLFITIKASHYKNEVQDELYRSAEAQHFIKL